MRCWGVINYKLQKIKNAAHLVLFALHLKRPEKPLKMEQKVGCDVKPKLCCEQLCLLYFLTPLHYVMLLPCNFPGLHCTTFLRCRTWTNDTRYSLGCLRLSGHPMKAELKCNDALCRVPFWPKLWETENETLPHTRLQQTWGSSDEQEA